MFLEAFAAAIATHIHSFYILCAKQRIAWMLPWPWQQHHLLQTKVERWQCSCCSLSFGCARTYQEEVMLLSRVRRTMYQVFFVIYLLNIKGKGNMVCRPTDDIHFCLGPALVPGFCSNPRMATEGKRAESIASAAPRTLPFHHQHKGSTEHRVWHQKGDVTA